MVMSEFPYVKAVLGDCGRVSVPDYVQKVVWVMGEAFQRILQAAAGRTIRSFQAQNVCFISKTSSLHWKAKLRNAWGQ